MTDHKINYPYLPEDGEIRYVPASNEFMQAAEQAAQELTVDGGQPIGGVLVQNGKIIARGVRHSQYHVDHGCERIRLHMPTGQGYELCEGCAPNNHCEPHVIDDAKANAKVTRGAELYLWGHWWCCEWCWKAMLDAGIRVVYLLEHSEVLFNKAAPGNILGAPKAADAPAAS